MGGAPNAPPSCLFRVMAEDLGFAIFCSLLPRKIPKQIQYPSHCFGILRGIAHIYWGNSYLEFPSLQSHSKWVTLYMNKIILL